MSQTGTTNGRANPTTITAEPGIPHIIVEREVDAPRALVFRAYTEPKLMEQWLGPRDLTMRIERHGNAHGDAYRFIHTDANGNEFAFRGVVHGPAGGASPETGMFRTFEWEGMPNHVSLEQLTLEPRANGQRTLIRTVSTFLSQADRDGMIASGMESGLKQAMERLDELMARLQG